MTTLPPHIANAETPRLIAFDERLKDECLTLMNEGKATSTIVKHASDSLFIFSRQLERENIYLREVLSELNRALLLHSYEGAHCLEETNEALTAYEQLKKDLAI